MVRVRDAFTLVELLITVSLLVIIIALGVPGYKKSHERADEREAISNLSLIASAMETYHVRYDNFPPANLLQVLDINTTLNIGIYEHRVDYSCTSSAATFTCTANPIAYSWDLNISNGDDGNPRCSAGTCPTCVSGGC